MRHLELWTTSPWGLYILAVLVLSFLLELVVERLDISYKAPPLPDDLKDVYNEEEAKTSRQYQLDRIKPGLIQLTLSFITTLLMIQWGGFGWVDRWTRQAFPNQDLVSGLMFIGVVVVATSCLSLPFKIYHTFVTETKYGFNRSTPQTFMMDQIKSIGLGCFLGGPITALLILAFSWAQSFDYAWACAWGLMTIISIILLFVSPLLMGLFNKYEELEAGPLRDDIFKLAKAQNFEVSGLYKMDGSKRSSKANAFFAGFGSFRRVALFDTLIEKLNTKQICAVLAHEIGHCKHHHIPKQFLFNSFIMAISFYAVQTFLMSPSLFELFQMSPSVAGGLFLTFSFVITPIQLLSSLISNGLSRTFEYQADAFATEQTGAGEALVEALKILSSDSLSNLQPHPFKAFMEHSHPTLIERSHHIKSLIQQST